MHCRTTCEYRGTGLIERGMTSQRAELRICRGHQKRLKTAKVGQMGDAAANVEKPVCVEGCMVTRRKPLVELEVAIRLEFFARGFHTILAQIWTVQVEARFHSVVP